MARTKRKVHVSEIGWGIVPSGSAAGEGSYLAVNAEGRVVLDVGGGGGVDLDIISGSLATYGIISGSNSTYHKISGSTGTFNFFDADRIITNQISGSTSNFNTNLGHVFSGSLGTFHRISGSTLTSNLIDTDRLIANQASGSTSNFNTNLGHVFSGSLGTFHRISGSTLTSNYIDVDRVGSNQINTVSLTASFAKITSLEVQELVSRTVTKDSLEIKDNLIIAAVSGSSAGDFVGSGFQLGGTAGVEGTGSSPLMSLTLGSRTFTGDSLIVNVDGQAGASFKSGSVTQAILGTSGMRFGVTGSISGSLLQAQKVETHILSSRGILSGATGNFHDLTGDDCVFGGIAVSSITASNSVILGSSNTDDLSFLGGQTTDLIPQNDNKVALGSATKRYTLISAMSASIAGAAGIVGTVTAGGVTSAGTVSGSAVTTHTVTADKSVVSHISGSRISVQTLQVFGQISGSGPNTLIKKEHIHKNIVQNNSDAHGGLSFSGGRLSVGFRKKIFVRADGSNISGSVPTKGMFATHAMATPYTTASLGAVPQSGTLMVYLNGVLLHGEHDLGDTNTTGSSAPHADYRINSGSGTSNQIKIFMNEDLSLDSDDILTVTFLSGSGVSG